MTPLTCAPQAQADDFGLADLFDPSTWALPYDDIDWGSFVDPAAWSSLFDAAAFDATAVGTATADPFGLDAAFNSFMSDVNSWVATNWIGTQFGDWVDNNLINPLGAAWASADSCGFICNGVAGTAADPDGQDGGWLFGNGGDGWNSTVAGEAGGNGGDANFWGDGGAGGAGGAGADGGDGGAGGSIFGSGGDGGRGGDGLAGTDGDNGVWGVAGAGGVD
ncbi:MAG: PGRS repeat-containing protein, partial [Mycolicibacter algericus]